jgi:hypothetical protein
LDSFGRIRTFQWVTENPNKKLSPVILCLDCHLDKREVRSGNWEKLSTDFRFFQENTEAPTPGGSEKMSHEAASFSAPPV